MSLLQCALELGAGRDPAVVDALVDSFLSFQGTRVIRRDADLSADRTEASFVLDSSVAPEAAFRAFVEACERIDITRSASKLPSTGAVEVLAFVPLGDATMEGATALAHKLGARVGRELEIPVYFFGRAAMRPERRDLDMLRRDDEGLRAQLGQSDVEREPDQGPQRPHKTAGLSAIGARRLRLAYNVDLSSDDEAVAEHIAHRVREHEGGLPGIHARPGTRSAGDDAGQGAKNAQVRVSIADYTQVGLIRVYEEIERLAGERGIEVASSELVGLVPKAALPPGTAERTKLLGFDPEMQFLEEFLTR